MTGGREIQGVPRPQRPLVVRGEFRTRVRYCECDPMGVAHHASYIAWLEEARTELLRGSGVTYRDLEAAGVYLVVTRIEIKYRRPARYDDSLVIAARVTGGGRARLDHAYEVRRARSDGGGGNEELLAEASSTLACVDGAGAPRPLPDWLRASSRPPD